MKLKLLASVTLASAALISNAYALQITQPIVSKVPVTDQATLAANHNKPLNKTVYLMGLNLTPKQIQRIQTKQTKVQSAKDLPSQVQQDLSGMPVLDQGMHGSCVTFAVTAAFDLLLGKGDYLSQLCSLELGKYLETNGYNPSGWDGSLGNILFAQLNDFGMVAKSYEKNKACGGLNSYPAYDENQTGSAMDPVAYKKISESLTNNKHFDYEAEPILTTSQYSDDNYPVDSNAVLNSVKQTLYAASKNADRAVTIGFLIPIKHCGLSAGACGSNHGMFDTWTLANEIVNDPNPPKPEELAGHEVVITGYDDNAVATDMDGLKHTGLLTIRNSWGSAVGDKGNFYMSYDYFVKYALEAHALVRLKADE